MTHKLFLIISSLSGALAVSLGAFGAHALKSKLSANGYLATYETAVQYHFIHTLALLAVGLLLNKYPNPWFANAGYAFTIGILIFSGSLYVLSMTSTRWLGAITPIGGLAFIAGWVMIAIGVLKAS